MHVKKINIPSFILWASLEKKIGFEKSASPSSCCKTHQLKILRFPRSLGFISRVNCTLYGRGFKFLSRVHEKPELWERRRISNSRYTAIDHRSFILSWTHAMIIHAPYSISNPYSCLEPSHNVLICSFSRTSNLSVTYVNVIRENLENNCRIFKRCASVNGSIS